MEQYDSQTRLETPQQQTHKKNAITGMVLGICGLAITWFPVAGLVLSIIGFCISRSNRKFAEANGILENGMNTAGYVCSLIGMIVGVVTILVAILCIILMCTIAGGLFNMVILPEIM